MTYKLNKAIQNSIEFHKKDLKKLHFFDVLNTNLDDNKRHFLMLDYGIKLISNLNISNVLTIGDKYCRDASYIKTQLRVNATASDLDTSNMKKAKEIGYIDDIININAEHISLEDDSFDVVFCKESYHHFPRPQLGLYEMIRIAKKAVVLIEPNDVRRNGRDENFIETGDYLDSFEDVGNYKYQISLREILKTSWALRLPHVGVIGFNDPYKTPFVYSDWLDEKQRLDNLGKSQKRAFNLLAICIYKQNIDRIDGAKIYNLPPIMHR